MVAHARQIGDTAAALQAVPLPYARTLWDHTHAISALSGAGVPDLKASQSVIQPIAL